MIYLLNKIFTWLRMTFQAIRNARNAWEPELKRLHDNLIKIEDSLAGTDDCVVDIFSLEEKHEDRLTVLEEKLVSVTTNNVDLKDQLNAFITNDVITNEGIEKKMGLLEDELYELKAENIEMRNHFNSMIKELNAITSFVNEKHGCDIIEKTFEIVPPPKRYNLRKGV